VVFSLAGESSKEAAMTLPKSTKPLTRERRGIDEHIADADKLARTGKRQEPVRNTPPFGDYDDTVPDAGAERPPKKVAPEQS
jgi:hypothetical protein